MGAERRNTLMMNALVISGLLALYSFLGMGLVPSGVNSVFLLHLGRVGLTVFCLVILAMIVFRAGPIESLMRLPHGGQRFAKNDLYLLLLPLTPISQYIALNQDVLSPPDSVVLFLGTALFAFLAGVVLPSLLSRSRAVMLASIALVYLVYSMASMSAQFEWHREGVFAIQLSIYILVAGLLCLVHFASRNTANMMLVLFFTSSLFVNLFAAVDDESFDTEVEQGSPESASDGIAFTRKSNVYHLTYESYGNDFAMKHYGIDNREQLEWLASQGFELYPGAHTLASASITSISRLFAMSVQLEADLREYIAGRSPVHRAFQRNGYDLHGIFSHDYLIQNVLVEYDEVFPRESNPLGQLVAAIAEGEFRFDVSYDATDYDAYLHAKRDALLATERPKFLYTHNRLPAHSQNSGQCLADETALYEERLREANLEMKKDIEIVLAADPDAIIVIAGDHGAYLTQNCMFLERDPGIGIEDIKRVDVHDRLGVLLAVRWPDWVEREPCDIRTLQDIYPAVFAALAGDRSLLELRTREPSLEQGLGGVVVQDGYIVGGRHDGEPLFVSGCHERSE